MEKMAGPSVSKMLVVQIGTEKLVFPPPLSLSRKEMKEWSLVMIERMKELRPLVACFNGKGIYEIFSGGKCTVGLQEQPLPGTETVSREYTYLNTLGQTLDNSLHG